MASPKATTRSALVHAQLREDVLQGVLAPGSRLRFAELAQRFSVSQSVVREALTRLAEQGLAVTVPQQGFRVTPLRLKDLDELTEARVELETMVLRLAVRRGDIAWESSVVAAHHQLAATPRTRPGGELNGAWFTAHEQFHQAALRGSGNDRLYGAAISLRDAASLYRWWSRQVGHDYDRDVDQEHSAILDAVVSRDEGRAIALLAGHIQRTTEALRAVATDEGEDAAPEAAASA
jgi:DNA-binding GntR family transcriptional regulator